MHPCRSRLLKRSLSFVSIVALVPCAPAGAQCVSDTLNSSSVQEDALFGSSGAIDGARLIIGSPFGDVGAGQNHGLADVFRFSGTSWVWDGQLTAANPLPYSLFGRAVDVDGTFALVGEPHRDMDGSQSVGNAHIFIRQSNGWQYGLTIEPPTGWPNIDNSHFGQAVALDGEYALIGMPDGPVDIDSKPGKAHLYRRVFSNTNWELVDTFTSPVMSDDADFGAVLAMNHGATSADTFAVIGHPRHSPSASLAESGQIRIYNRPTSGTDWGGGVPVTPGDPQAGAHFGSAVAISGGTMVVGAADYDGAAVDTGAVYIFNRQPNGSWAESARIDNPVGLVSANFGCLVSIDGDRLAISSTGRLFIYRRIAGAWVHEWTMTGQTSDFAERAAGIFGTTAFAGSPATPVNGQILAGNASVFELKDNNGANACNQATIVSGAGAWGCTNAATRDGRSSCDPVNGGRDVWYRWYAPCDGVATFDTEYSDFDTLLSVHIDCPTPQQTHQVACNQAPGSDYAWVSLEVLEGQSYLIRIAGASLSEYGNYVLNIEMNCAPPCPADIAPQSLGDGAVNVNDLLLVITTWNVPHGAGDVNHDSLVDVNDLLAVVTAWGDCPPVK